MYGKPLVNFVMTRNRLFLPRGRVDENIMATAMPSEEAACLLEFDE
jgi:hypothetical protein